MRGVISRLVILLLAVSGNRIYAVQVTPDEMAAAREWITDHLGPEAKVPPFSFTYNGKSSTSFLGTWKKTRASKKLDEFRTQCITTYANPETSLEVRCVGVTYHDYPTAEWTLYIKNIGATDTPIISDVMPIDMSINSKGGKDFLLHNWVYSVPDDLQPKESIIKPGDNLRFTPVNGRPTSSKMPNYNIETGDGGVIAVLGWPGHWVSQFKCDAESGLRIRAGQELTHFKLHPDEEVRTPLVVVQFYKGNWVRGQNIWRRWMVKHNLPRPGGKLVQPMIEAGSSGTLGYWGMREENQKQFISHYLADGLKFDAYWMDLSWFQIDTKTYMHTALYKPHPEWFPNGLHPLSDLLHKNGKKLMCWFEPEHHYPGPMNWVCQNKPEWLLKAPPGHEAEANQGLPLGDRRLFDMGNPAAVEWLVSNTLRAMDEQGIDYYRHDFNIEPLIFWRGNDAEDRQGIAEIKYVTGFLKYYDELLRRKPTILIDNCASGGQRNDLETMRRSVPLWRSDCAFDPTVAQTQTYGIAFWLPYFGSGLNRTDVYSIRSCMFPSIIVDVDYRRHDLDTSNVVRLLNGEWRNAVAPNYFGDYYPLLPATMAQDIWVAWQFDRPEDGKGVIQAFRRSQAEKKSCRLKLFGLDVEARYSVRKLDEDKDARMNGRELMEKGFLITIPDKPGAAVITYKKTEGVRP